MHQLSANIRLARWQGQQLHGEVILVATITGHSPGGIPQWWHLTRLRCVPTVCVLVSRSQSGHLSGHYHGQSIELILSLSPGGKYRAWCHKQITCLNKCTMSTMALFSHGSLYTFSNRIHIYIYTQYINKYWWNIPIFPKSVNSRRSITHCFTWTVLGHITFGWTVCMVVKYSTVTFIHQRM